MDDTPAPDQAARFADAGPWFENLSPAATGNLIAEASDIALLIDVDGIVRDMSLGAEDLRASGLREWVGKPWVDLVTAESRPKVRDLLTARTEKRGPRSREINHLSPKGGNLPIRFSATPAGEDGRMIAIGRDLRGAAQLQQRLVLAQQAMEREYVRIRSAEMRYRMLFQSSSEPIVILDAVGMRVVEANHAARAEVFDKPERAAIDSILTPFDEDGSARIRVALAAARASGRCEPTDVALARNGRRFSLSATQFRQEGVEYLLVHLTPLDSPLADVARSELPRTVDVVERMPDAFALIGQDLRILSCNTAFLELAQIPAKRQAIGERLDRWFGRPGVDAMLIVESLAENGVLRHYASVMRGQYGGEEEIEVSGVSSTHDGQPIYGLILRPVGLRGMLERSQIGPLPRSVEQLTELVGRVPLKELVRETTDIIEKLCIDAALQLSRDNRASAAQMLGLSRQSFYQKMRRHGLGDLDDLDAEPDA